MTRNLGYDNFGNVNSASIVGIGMTARTTTASWGTTGRFPQSITNPLSQTTQLGWDAATGTLSSMTDPNGIATSWLYDGFGRRTRENRPDGTATTWAYVTCPAPSYCGFPTLRYYVETSLFDTGNTLKRDDLQFFDAFDRLSFDEPRLLNGDRGYTRIVYDSLGRVSQSSAPTFYSAPQLYWTTYQYDLLNRATQISRPISDSNPTLQTTYSYHEGLTTRSVDALGKQSTAVVNVLGTLARSTDHNGYYQSFDYDGFGNLLRVVDSASNTLQSNTYNIRGMRTGQTDLDMGSWTYTPNALGETVTQIDAKSQSSTFGYDLLGRLTSRVEPEGTSNFVFGTSATLKNIGRLASVSGPGYSEGFTYDSIGRPQQKTITSDATYLLNYAYNSIGAVDTLTYPTSTSSYRLKLQYEYQNGLLMRVKDFNAPTTVFWVANDTDPRGNVTSETLGNGIQTTRSFDGVTGLLDHIQSGPGGGTARQNLNYMWDKVGNLTQRQDVNLSLIEAFYYDNLHRLDYSTLNGTTNLDLAYDALGNISSKSDVGAYTYHATKKHAVTAAGSNTYGYDANGNLNSRNGSSITWYSYGLPNLISGPSSNSSQFFYAPDRSRWKQVASYAGTSEQTIYIGGLIEKVTLGGVASWKHYIAGASGPVAVYIRRSSGTNETVYLLKDHFGSTDIITNSAGMQMSRLSFGAFGTRRNGGTWSGNPAASAWTTITNTTRHGFTSHEMLDNLNLTHMNGRVFDQVIGRFLSADPFVQAPGFTQSFNRYSYTSNSPLSRVDPSGFADIETVVVTGSRGRDPGNGGQPSNAYPPVSGNQNGHLPPEIEQSIEGVTVWARRMHEIALQWRRTAGTGSEDDSERQRDSAESGWQWDSQELRNWACTAGNFLETGAEIGGQAAMAIEATGLGVAFGGLVSGAEPVALVGGAIMATGGMTNLAASGFQTLGGLAQVVGGDSTTGWGNVGYGALNIGASLTPLGLSNYLVTKGLTVSQRMFNSQLQAGFAWAGAVSDSITFLSPDAAPKQATCSR